MPNGEGGKALMKLFKRIKAVFQDGFTDEGVRRRLMFDLLNIVLGTVSLVMTAVNIFTHETVLMIATAIFSVLCFANFGLVRIKPLRAVVYGLFTVESLGLLSFFIVTGIPEGFSVLWILLVPSFTVAIFRARFGGIFSGLAFLLVIFFFWIPFGRELLLYDYSETFMLRFPFVYICLFLIALYIEFVRMGTWRRLRESETRYRYLSRHDALTGIYSRHAFHQELDRIFATPSDEPAAIVIFDIDDFKKINDTHGHNGGDVVLKQMADIVITNLCEHSIACRWGGEEFLVLMRCRHDPQAFAETVRRAVEASPVEYDGRTIHYTVSAGISDTGRMSRDQLVEFINHADRAMYLSKSAGKNRTTVVHMTEK